MLDRQRRVLKDFSSSRLDLALAQPSRPAGSKQGRFPGGEILALPSQRILVDGVKVPSVAIDICGLNRGHAQVRSGPCWRTKESEAKF